MIEMGHSNVTALTLVIWLPLTGAHAIQEVDRHIQREKKRSRNNTEEARSLLIMPQDIYTQAIKYLSMQQKQYAVNMTWNEKLDHAELKLKDIREIMEYFGPLNFRLT